MTTVFLVVRDEGERSDREWEVVAVCSTLERAETIVRDTTVQDGECKGSLLITNWDVDGACHGTLDDAVARAVDAARLVLQAGGRRYTAQLARPRGDRVTEASRLYRLHQDGEISSDEYLSSVKALGL